MSEAAADRRGRLLLAAGALLGIGLAAWGVVGSGPSTPETLDAVAMVNGQPLSREAYDRFIAAVSAERKSAVLPIEERRRLLDRLVDEELLLQHGISLGLARHEPTARRLIVQSVIAAVTGAAEAREPEDSELRAYYARNPERFTRPGRLVTEALVVPVAAGEDDSARALARVVADFLATGGSLADARARWPVLAQPPLPGGPLPVETLRRYLGPTAALRAQALEPGATAEPLRASAGYVVLRLVDRSPDRVPPFEEVAEAVRAEWTRDQGESALRRFLDELRAAADVRIADLGEPTGASEQRAAP
jgi:hypothetical protein